MKIIQKYFFIAVLIITATTEITTAQEITDIIQPVQLTAGRQDTIMVSDLFYSPSYGLRFARNKNVLTSYSSTSSTLVIKPTSNNFGATLLEFTLNGKKNYVPVVMNSGAISQQVHKFLFKSDAAVNEAAVFGSFNNWNKKSHQLKYIKKSGFYELAVPLDPGSYIYKFIVDGKEILDPANPEKTPTGFDDFNSVLRIENTDKTKIFLHVGGRTETNNEVTFSFFYENNVQKNPITKNNIIALLDNKKIIESSIRLSNNLIELRFTKQRLDGEKVLRVLVTQNGKNTNLQQVQLFNGEPLGNNSKKQLWDDGSIYSIMIDRFNDGDRANNNPVLHDSIFTQANYQGGDLRGIINKIDEGYFDSLGINILWLSPVYDNPDIAFREYPSPHRWYSGYHGYWPISEKNVEKKFGTMEELKELIAKAHKHKIKVLLDFVAHHVHIDHPFYQQHPKWFGTLELPDGRKNLRLWDEHRLTTWFEPYMPSFDFTKSNEAINVVADNAIWWLNETGADGFRHDAVKHVPNEFWRALTKKIKEEIEIPMRKKVYQIGETFGDYDLISSYVNNGQLNAQFNFNLSYFAIPVFTEPGKSFSSIDFHMKKSFQSFGYNNLMGNIMDSHDKVRFMAYADGAIQLQGVDTREMAWNNPPTVRHPKSYEKAKLYFAYMFTIPGLPVVYYGSEFGMTGADDPDNRRMMRFSDSLSVYEKQMLNETRKIIAMRNQHSALRYGDFLTLQADTTVYAYVRSDMNERVVVVLNKSEMQQNVDLTLSEIYGAKELVDVMTGEKIVVTKNIARTIVSSVNWRVFKIN